MASPGGTARRDNLIELGRTSTMRFDSTLADISGSAIVWLLFGCGLLAVVIRGICIVWFSPRQRCPYDGVPLDRVAAHPHFDVFVSYKSDDVVFARAVVDRLLASGLRVWFAEYCIRLPEHVSTASNPQAFQHRIDCGIRNSQRGVLLTSEAYFGSPHTCHEMVQLVKTLGPSKVREFRIDWREFPLLQKSKTASLVESKLWSKICASDKMHPMREQMRDARTRSALAALKSVITTEIDDCAIAIAKLCGHSQIDQSPAFGSHPCQESAVDGEFLRLELDSAGWEHEQMSHFLEYRSQPEGVRCSFNVLIGPHDPQDGLQLDSDDDSEDSDRRLYNALRAYAKRHAIRLHHKLIGVHLVFKALNVGIAVTYFNRLQQSWSRKYAVYINVTDRGPQECVITFQVRGDFTQFMALSDEMNRVVASIGVTPRYRPWEY